MRLQNFLIDFQEKSLVVDLAPPESRPRILCLHGGGMTGRKAFTPLRELLLQQKIATCAFDFIGHGETGGDISFSSLKKRTEQTQAVISSLMLPQPLSIIASSMGGYTAIKLTELNQIENLILFAPAMYAEDVYDIAFGPEFTKSIRRMNSWRKSDAWGIMKKYTGNLVIFKAERDQIIPEEVIERIYDSAENAKTKEVVVLQNATHPLMPWLSERAASLQSVVSKISKIILNK